MIKSIFFASLLCISVLSHIEIPLYKSPLAYEDLKKSDLMIDDIDKTHFLVNLNMGTPSKSYPLQVEMATETINLNQKEIFYLKKFPNLSRLKK